MACPLPSLSSFRCGFLLGYLASQALYLVWLGLRLLLEVVLSARYVPPSHGSTALAGGGQPGPATQTEPLISFTASVVADLLVTALAGVVLFGVILGRGSPRSWQSTNA
jgi:hypothetical protein